MLYMAFISKDYLGSFSHSQTFSVQEHAYTVAMLACRTYTHTQHTHTHTNKYNTKHIHTNIMHFSSYTTKDNVDFTCYHGGLDRIHPWKFTPSHACLLTYLLIYIYLQSIYI